MVVVMFLCPSRCCTALTFAPDSIKRVAWVWQAVILKGDRGDIFSLQVAVHHGYHGGIVIHLTDNRLDIRFPGKLRSTEPAVSGDNLKFSILGWTNQNGIDHTASHDAVDGILHQLIVISDFERMIFEGL